MGGKLRIGAGAQGSRGYHCGVAPWLRLSCYWFFATGALGLYFPYIALYLKENVGLTGAEAGTILAIPPLVGIVAQPMWGQLADRTGSRTRVLSLLCLASGFGYCGLMLPRSFASMALAVFGFALFVSSVIPMANSVSMAALSREGTSAFGRVRVWGTIGYLIMVVSAPIALDAYQERAGAPAVPGAPSEPGLQYAFAGAAVLIWIAALCARGLPATSQLSARAAASDYRTLLSRRDYLRLLVFNFGGYFFLHGPMVLFPVYVRARGGDMGELSQLWIWMVALEIPLVFYSGSIFERFGPKRMIALAIAAGGLRWVICAASPSLSTTYPAQILHAIVISGLIVGAALYVDRLIPEHLRSTAQSGLTMTSALGGILSSTLGGTLLDVAGVDALYWAGGAGALLWALLSVVILPRAVQPQDDAELTASAQLSP